MDTKHTDRRTFLKSSLSTAAIAAAPLVLTARRGDAAQAQGATAQPGGEPRIRFAAIGMNHGHINGQCDALIRAGGELVSFYAKEPDLAAAFAKRYPKAVLAKSEQEILDDKRIQLVTSAAIASERAPLGIRVMKAGKDFLSDKPAMTTLAQLAEVRKVQAETKRIFSVMYSERHENRATVKAGELVQAGAIGTVIQTVGLGPHREIQGAAGAARLVLRQGAVRRHPHRHRLAPVRPVPVLHELDRGQGRGLAGRQPAPRRQARPRGLRRLHGPRQRRHRLHPRRLVHAEGPGHLGRRPPDHPRHRRLHRGPQEHRHRLGQAGRQPSLSGRPEGDALRRLQGRRAALRRQADRRRAQPHRDVDDAEAHVPGDAARARGRSQRAAASARSR